MEFFCKQTAEIRQMKFYKRMNPWWQVMHIVGSTSTMLRRAGFDSRWERWQWTRWAVPTIPGPSSPTWPAWDSITSTSSRNRLLNGGTNIFFICFLSRKYTSVLFSGKFWHLANHFFYAYILVGDEWRSYGAWWLSKADGWRSWKRTCLLRQLPKNTERDRSKGVANTF